jgi:glycosyltransferase involved in cell wall biosynthesis
LPVACSDIPVLREICQDAAVYFDPHSPDALVAAVGQVVNEVETRKAMMDRGIARASMFSWHKLAEETLSIYEQNTKHV